MKYRFLMWTSSWVDLLVTLIEIATFECWVPSWDIDYYIYLTGDDDLLLDCPRCNPLVED